MKNITKKVALFCLFSYILTSFSYAHSIGDKVYKEVVVKGETVSKWLILYSIDEYDNKGNIIYEKNSDGDEYWYEYDIKGNLIHFKNSDGKERWHEYDDKGNEIHYKSHDSKEKWWEYDYHPNGKVKQCLCWKAM